MEFITPLYIAGFLAFELIKQVVEDTITRSPQFYQSLTKRLNFCCGVEKWFLTGFITQLRRFESCPRYQLGISVQRTVKTLGVPSLELNLLVLLTTKVILNIIQCENISGDSSVGRARVNKITVFVIKIDSLQI